MVHGLGPKGWSMDWVQRGGPWTGSKGVVHGPEVHVLYTSHADNSPLSHGGHLIMKSRLSVTQLYGIMPNRDHCCVPLCTNNRSKGDTGITFHCFPTNRKLKRTWIVKIRRDVGKTFQVSNVFSLRNCFTLHSRVSAYKNKPSFK